MKRQRKCTGAARGRYTAELAEPHLASALNRRPVASGQFLRPDVAKHTVNIQDLCCFSCFFLSSSAQPNVRLSRILTGQTHLKSSFHLFGTLMCSCIGDTETEVAVVVSSVKRRVGSGE